MAAILMCPAAMVLPYPDAVNHEASHPPAPWLRRQLRRPATTVNDPSTWIEVCGMRVSCRAAVWMTPCGSSGSGSDRDEAHERGHTCPADRAIHRSLGL